MLSALRAYGSDATDQLAIGNAALGRNLRKALPEDDFDRQPIAGGGGRYLLVADVRIDNRDELIAKLGLDNRVASTMSDAALLMAAWEKWQLDCHEEMLGDHAFAVWDSMDSSLTLVRSAFAVKPLFYHVGFGFTAFASMPAGLLALSNVPRSLNFHHAAALAARYSYLGSSTMFESIRQVRHGHAVRLKGDSEQVIQLLRLAKPEPRFRKLADYGEALRAELDRAVGAQLRRHGGPAAAQLSSGRDSSAVTAAAALALARRGEELLAFTGAPQTGFQGLPLPGKMPDESGLAAKTAALYPNIRHSVSRPSPGSAIPFLRLLNEHHYGPMINVANLPWWVKINDEASTAGAKILLSGGTGNFSISAGGLHHLRDLLVEQGAWAWMRRAWAIGRSSPSAWRTIANATFSPLLPRSLYLPLLKATGRWPSDTLKVPILRSPYREEAEMLLQERWGDPRRPKNYSEFRRELLLMRDNPEMISVSCWGIEPRDPTADRRLVQLCLSFPAEQLASASSVRPVYEAAFRDRLPPEVLRSDRRGYQGADWMEHFQRDDVQAAFRAYARNPIVRELLNLDYIEELIAAWPSAGWDRLETLGTYRSTLLGALALANYIDVHFPQG